MLTWPAKDPDEVLDYSVDWSARLGADTITGSTFTLETAAGVSITTSSYVDDTSTVWLSGGTAGGTAIVRNRITTQAGRTMDQTVSLNIRSK